MRKKSLTLLLISVCGTLTGGVLLLSSLAHADTVVKPNTFTSGTPASADEVNANFDTVYDQVNKVGGAITVDPVDNRVGIGTQTPNGELHVVSTQIVPGVVGFSGTGLDDIVVDSTGYTGTGTVAYAVRVQNVGPNPDQIEYSADGGGNWSSPTDMVASGLDIGNGVTIGFAALDGHTYGDQWSWTVSLVNVDGIVVSGGKVAVKEISIENGAANGYVLTSDAAGNTTWQPTAPDNDNDPANELQTVSVLGTNLTLSDGGGTVSIADNDNDPANELNDSLVLMGTNLRLKDNGGTLIADLTSLINDADADSANELNTSVAMNGTSLEVTDAGGVLSAELAETLAIDNLSDAKYDGSSLFLGAQSGGVDDGTNNANASLGTLTLHANTSGYNNTALGSHALYANIDGANNTATGSQALYYNTTGGANTANGAFALYLNTTGANNTANGYFALAQNSTGVDNTATGYNALAQNTGNNNTATGSSALYSNTTGY
ncbi:MAG: hypothetical protein KKG70_12940, partial [Proteobacteria bacterium]|nr:hypothetical protein [Pseudomonadota bacterium]